MENGGRDALAVGGYNEDVKIMLDNTDMHVKIHNELDKDTFAKEENINIINGRIRFIVNGKEIVRENHEED